MNMKKTDSLSCVKMENRKENKMGIMPVPKLVISMSLPIMVSMLIKNTFSIQRI